MRQLEIKVLLIYVVFLVTSLIKTQVVKMHRMYKIFKFGVVYNLQCFDNSLTLSRNWQLLFCVV